MSKESKMRFSRKTGATNAFIILLLIVAWVMVCMEETATVINTLNGNPIYKGDGSKKEVALTVNVVWGDEYLDDILNILARENVKATFFIGGKWAENSSDLLLKIAADGHEIGSHSYNHEHMEQLSYGQTVDAIKKTADVIFSICGVTPTLFAPPYGEFDDTTLKAARDLGCKTIMWSVDTIDWRGDGVSAILDRIRTKCHDGAIILSHPTADTVAALPEIISIVRNSGRSFVTVGQMQGVE